MLGYRVIGRPGAILLVVTLLGACGAGASQTPAQSPAQSPVSSSPAADADQALLAKMGTVFDEPFDAARVAALFAPNATLYDRISNVTSTGLEAIQARFSQLAGVKFISKRTSAPISQDDFVAFFEEHGDSSRAQASGLVLLQVKDGKILNQWVYDAGPLPAASSSPAADADQALLDDLAAVMSNPYDAAKVAALYAPDAVIDETTADQTHTGLDQIEARIREFNESKFKAAVTSVPIRHGNFVAAFHEYGTGGDLSGRALVVYELKDGKVLNQWVYPAE